MFKALSNIPIFRRLAIAFVIATFIPTLVILLQSNFSLQSSELRSQSVHISFDAQNTATREQINLQRMNALLQARFAQVFAQGSLFLEGDPSSGKLTENDVEALETEFAQTLVSYQRNYEIATSPAMSNIRSVLISDAPDQGQRVITEQRLALDTVARSNWPTYQALLHKVLKDLETNTFYQTAYADFYQADLGFLELKNRWQQVVDSATMMGTTVTQVGPSLITPILVYTVITLLFTLLVIVAAGFLINISIIRPLSQLVALTKRVARGETDARATLPGRDEISLVAMSMNGMLDVTGQLTREAQNRHMNLQAQIGKLIHEVNGIGEGDLRIQAEVMPNELGRLAEFFNLTAGQLNNLVVNVKMLARGVQNATLQTFGYMEQLVYNADTQMQHIVEAAEEVSNVSNSSQQVARRTSMLSSVASEARSVAQRGRTAVQQTVDEMARINNNVHFTTGKVLALGERSLEIKDIVEVMSNIAQQTNRLALDAAVQAAMAGDQGTGFGAIAVDIRRLAERSKEQTIRIRKIVKGVLEDINTAEQSIQETEQEVATGRILTEEVGNAFESIFSVVEYQASEIEGTNQVALQQLQSSRRVEHIMKLVADSTQQGSNSTNQATQQMKTLAQIAGRLLTSVEVFKLREDRKLYTIVAESKPILTQTNRRLNTQPRSDIDRAFQ